MSLVAAAVEQTHRLPAPPIVFGIASMAIFVVLLFVVTRFDPDR